MDALRLLVLISLAIFLGEAGIMMLLEHFGVENVVQRAVLDASALALVAFPFVYFLAVRPLVKRADDLAAARAQLVETSHHLEERIAERTEEIAAAKSRLEETVAQLEHRQRQMVQLGETIGLLQACHGLDEAAGIAKRQVQRLLPNACGAIFLINASRTMMEKVASWGAGEKLPDCYAPAECWAVRRSRPHCVGCGESSLGCSQLPFAVETAHLCLPLTSQGETFGVLCLTANADNGEFRELETNGRLPLYAAFAEHLALAIANLRLRETLRFQASRDSLTSLYNRRYLLDVLDHEIERAVARDQNLSVVMIDADHFKWFNDSFGHAAGDAVLRELGRLLREWARPDDIVARYGGEEFTVVMPDTTGGDALDRVEKLRRRIESLVITHQGQTLASVTVSAGVATFPLQGADASALISLADQALYVAKQAGRNCVELASSVAGLTRVAAGAAHPRAPVAANA